MARNKVRPICILAPDSSSSCSQKGAGKGKGRAPANSGDGGDDSWRSAVILKEDMNNERFEKYYKAQGILSDDEWASFMDAMRTPLPTTFRVTGSRQ